MLRAALLLALGAQLRCGFAFRGAAVTRGRAPSKIRRLQHVSLQASPVLEPGSGFDALSLGAPVVHRYRRDDILTGEYWIMWYHGRSASIQEDGVVPLSTGRIGRAESEDGVHWKRVPSDQYDEGEGAFLDRNGDDWWSFDTAHVGLGDVTLVANDQTGLRDLTERQGATAYFMYTFGGDYAEDPSGRKGSNMKIGVCVSQDGEHWSRIEGPGATGGCLEPGEEGEWDASFVGWPQVLPCVTSDDEFAMYYNSFDKDHKKFAVGMATSRDGVKWSKVGKIFDGSGAEGAWDEGGVSRRHVMRTPSGEKKYTMWYEGVSAEGVHAIGVATSADGVRWEASADAPVFTPSEDAEAWDAGGVGSPRLVSMEDGSFYMYYVGYPKDADGAAAGPKRGCIGLAVNRNGDGRTWERMALEP